MATTSSKTNPPPSRRAPASSPSPTPSTLQRGATARSAASPRLSTLNGVNARRHTISKSPSPSAVGNGDTPEVLAASLKQETDQKELLLVQVQEKEQLLSNYATENNNLTFALNSAETRLNELYAEQSRWEAELAQRIDISEKLRDQVRELEKEKRDLQRRYNEQTETFEAERQAFYDNEQHLKSRIQSLTEARKRAETLTTHVDPETEDEKEENEPSISLIKQTKPESTRQETDLNDPENEPAEMTSLKLELSTLSTSYSSLQSTLILMQTQLVDLKRVNQELQEENESYMILLREKTLNGQFDLMRQVGGTTSTDDEASDDGDLDDTTSSMRSHGRSQLDRVEEEDSLDIMESELPGHVSDPDESQLSRISRHSRPDRKRTLSSHGGRGESLANLPITGPGLDLAAELGRAENKDILAGNPIEDRDRPHKGKRSKKGSDGSRLGISESAGVDSNTSTADIDALRTEVKSLKDANKALSLYASKIIDRIISQEGFEHVLAVDYDKEPQTPATAIPNSNSSKLPFGQSISKQRPQSVIVGRSSSNPNADIKNASPKISAPDPKAKRRSLSIDWSTLFGGEKKPEPPSNLRPLKLTPGSTSMTGARKLDNIEDEEDRKERERLNATMKLMGYQPQIQSPMNSPTPSFIERAFSAPAPAAANPTPKNNRRFSLFGSRTPVETSESASIHSTSSSLGQFSRGQSGLTEEALEHVQAENSLAALDARERDLSVEIAKGSGGGFTEIVPRASRRGRKSAGSSGSTVWSAGMSAGDD
ncbi:hypothetical protein JR316_0000880 [Psilocybe cubensis]|uniref:Uncharacterized protein n=2 Tax=Psilocybe cubensis TaxID=181762 RepID=A0ACB8HI21_PSICU|nr:hypothetical protein JR316_0000880 [Psilocybe cubensis]KAH9486815.1 hypothetical protein JR316_0000880 [Psilocybe cubensis]